MSELSLCRLQTLKGWFDGRVILYNCLLNNSHKECMDLTINKNTSDKKIWLSVFEFVGSAQSCLDSAQSCLDSAQSCLDSAQSCQDSARDITQGLTRDLLLKVFYTEKLISRE